MSQKTFLGIEISGDITYAEHRAIQRPKEELTPIVQAVLDDEHVVEFGWHQYTPYFNDGDPCVFSAGTVWIKTDADKNPDDDDYYGDEHYDVEYGEGVLGQARGEYDTRTYLPDPNQEPWVLALHAEAMALNAAVEGGAFDDVLLEVFGDHAEITVRRDGIRVESYSHD